MTNFKVKLININDKWYFADQLSLDARGKTVSKFKAFYVLLLFLNDVFRVISAEVHRGATATRSAC